MVAERADDLKDAGIDLSDVWLAARLSDRFPRTKIAPSYSATVAYQTTR